MLRLDWLSQEVSGDVYKMTPTRPGYYLTKYPGLCLLNEQGIEGQGINIPFPFILHYQGRGVLPLSWRHKMFSTGAKV